MKKRFPNTLSHLFLSIATAIAVVSSTVAQTGESDAVYELSPFEVESSQDRGYGVTHTLGAGRVNSAILDLPLNVATVGQELFKDMNINQVAQAMTFVSGVTRVSGIANGRITVRGTDSQAMRFRDGLPDEHQVFNGGIVLDPIDIDRIEILKGPNGSIYGSHSIGGVVNRVSKRPLSDSSSSVNFTVGSWDFYRLDLDTTGSLNDEGNLTYRFTTALQDAEWQNGADNNKDAYTGYLAYAPNENSRLWGRVSYQTSDVDNNGSNGTLALDRDKNISFFMDIEEVGLDFVTDIGREMDKTLMEVGFEQRFTPGSSVWNFRTVARYNDISMPGWTFYGRSSGNFQFRDSSGNQLTFVDGNGNTVGRTAANSLWSDRDPNGDIFVTSQTRTRREGDREWRFVSADLAGAFDTGSLSHRLLTYLQFSEDDQLHLQFRSSGSEFGGSAIKTLPPANPQNVAMQLGESNNRNRTSEGEQFAFGFQDNISFLEDKFIVLLGGRYDWGRGWSYDRAYPTNEITNVRNDGSTNSDWSFKGGLVYKVKEGVSLFYQNTETYTPAGGMDDFGNVIDNRDGLSDEIGIKVFTKDSRVSTTLSFFDTEENNFIVLVQDPNDPEGPRLRQASGLHTIDGFELDVAWQPVDNLSFLLAYSDTDSTLANGRTPRGVTTKPNYSALVRYEFSEGSLANLSVGLGLEHVGDDRAGDSANTFRLPGYDVFNAFFGYRLGDWTFRLNLDNITDEVYAATAVNSRRIDGGLPFNGRFMVGKRF